jgi:hypothetical protein
MASETFVLDKDKVRRTDMHFDEVDDTITFNTVQDVGPMLDENKKKMNAYGDKLSLGKRGEWHHTASIPITVWEQWMKDTNGAIEKDTKLLAAYLNNPDYKYFKVAPTNL